MNKKRTLIVSAAAALAAVMIIGVGVAAAQGPRGNNSARNAARDAANNPAVGQSLQTSQQLHVVPQEDGTLAANMMSQRRGPSGQQQMGGYFGSIYELMPAFEGELPADVADALLEGLADELHAEAVYAAVIAQFGDVAPFSAIIQSEVNHAASLQSALDYYGVDYAGITAEVEALSIETLADACTIAADAEIANFELYDSWLATVSDYPDLVQIFTNLRNASEFSHLPAFQTCAG
jgi:hypothetical protein